MLVRLWKTYKGLIFKQYTDFYSGRKCIDYLLNKQNFRCGSLFAVPLIILDRHKF